MKEERKKYFKFGALVFVLFLCIHYWNAFAHMISIGFKAAVPLLMGCIIAYIVNILMSFYEKHYFPARAGGIAQKSRRPVCMLAAFFTLVLIVSLVIRLIVPELVSCIQLLFAELPDAMRFLTNLRFVADVLPANVTESLQAVDWNSVLSKILKVLSSGIGTTVTAAVDVLSSVFSTTVNLLIGAVFSIYLLLGKERLQSQCDRVIKRYGRPSFTKKLYYVLTVANGCFHKYIVGQCIEAIILGTLCAVGMFIFRFPYALMTGAVIGVTALIPVAGAYIGGAVGFILILSVSPAKAVLFIVYLVALQQIEGNLIYPKVVGSSLGLPGIWVLATVTVGGGICGIPGMLVGVPLAAAVYQMLRSDLNKDKLPEGNLQEER